MEKKQCSRCHEQKDVEQFSFRNKATGKRCNICLECQRVYVRKHYQKKKADYKARAKRNRDARRNENRRKVVEYLQSHPCVDCNEKDPVVLTFDHVRGKKLTEVSKLLFWAKWETVEKEIAKCDVRCANCHMRRTAKQLGWHYASVAQR